MRRPEGSQRVPCEPRQGPVRSPAGCDTSRVVDFVPGRVLCRAFYEEVLESKVEVPHSAGLLGPGSDVIACDTERSTDHDWGPRCIVFVPDSAVEEVRSRVLNDLPETYRGWPVAIGRDEQPLEPRVEVDSLSSWISRQMGWDCSSGDLSVTDWLLIPQQRLLGVTEGSVFADPHGELARLRARLAWYPEPVYWWLLACQWRRLAQEEPFVQRTAEVGDDVGSRIITGRLARDCMRLALLIGRRYAPYEKWLGTAFARLPDPDGLGSSINHAMTAASYSDREAALGHAYRALAGRYNDLADSDVDSSLRPFFDRPAWILGANRFTTDALDRVADPMLATRPLIGSIDQMIDCTDVLADPNQTSLLRSYYRASGFEN
jgi:hypothetical protein